MSFKQRLSLTWSHGLNTFSRQDFASLVFLHTKKDYKVHRVNDLVRLICFTAGCLQRPSSLAPCLSPMEREAGVGRGGTALSSPHRALRDSTRVTNGPEKMAAFMALQ